MLLLFCVFVFFWGDNFAMYLREKVNVLPVSDLFFQVESWNQTQLIVLVNAVPHGGQVDSL